MTPDHLSLINNDSIEAFNIGRRLERLSLEEVYGTIVTYEEQVRGWLAYVAKSIGKEAQVEAYRRLREHLDDFRTIPILNYDETAAGIYEQLRSARVRIGTMDLKIAAIALANNALLLTRNRVDFEKVPGLHCEDWTI